MAEISDLRAKYPLLVVMRDNAAENKSKAISDYFTSMMVENYYATAFESHQDGLAEVAIKSVFTLARSCEWLSLGSEENTGIMQPHMERIAEMSLTRKGLRVRLGD
jgi:hypothetical protein